MKVISEEDISIIWCEDCELYHLVINEGMTKHIYIINDEDKKQLKEKLKIDIIENIPACDEVEKIIYSIQDTIDEL